jgi:hypothetical protein
MRGRVFVEKGDMVLISLREFEFGASKTDVGGDIIAKYPYESLSRLRKQEGMNPKLFMQLDVLDGTKLAEIGGEDGWEFDREDEEGVDEDEEGANEEKPATTKSKDDDDDNIDIDAI